MDLGIVTFIAPDKSHGYLLKLEELSEKYVFDTIKRSSKDDSFKFDLKVEDMGLRRFQIVKFSETGKSKKSGKHFAKIDSTYFRAIVEKLGNENKITIVEFDSAFYILKSSEKQFSETQTGIVIFQLIANIEKSSAQLTFDRITSNFEGKGATGFWLDKFVKIVAIYNERFASVFDTILETIIPFLQSPFQQSFDLNKLLSKSIKGLAENCSNQEYQSLIFFIQRWHEKYPDFFHYSRVEKILNPNAALKAELWVSDSYLFEELFASQNQIPKAVIEYSLGRDEDWQRSFLTKLKSIDAPLTEVEYILLNLIPRDLPEDFSNIRSSLEFINANFLELKSKFLEELKKNRSPKEQISLWENGLTGPPSINILRELFNEVSDATKSQIINSVPPFDKILLLNSSLKNGLQISAYYKNIFKVVKAIINDSAICVFDLEYDGHNIKELAFTQNHGIEFATTQEEIEELLPRFQITLNNLPSFLAGHNIEKFDIPLLREKIEIPATIGLIDTLSIETLLSPTLKSFALDTKHNAKADTAHTLDLLTNQVIRLIHIPEKQLKKFEVFISANFLTLLYQLRENISENRVELFDQLEAERNSYFLSKESGTEQIAEFKRFITDKAGAPSFIIAPREFYPLLSELPNIQFVGDGTDYSKIVSAKKVNNLSDRTLEKYLLEAFIEKCDAVSKTPIYANLPGRIKILIAENVTTDSITEESSFFSETTNQLCISPDRLADAIPLIKESNRAIILLESALISVTQKTLVKTLDYTIFQQRLNSDAFWIYFTGGQSLVEISREDLENLQVEKISKHLEFFWIEKTSFDTFQVWGNYDFRKQLKNELPENKIFEFSFSQDELKKENCKYVIPKSSPGKLSITRYNPETRYRDRYWTFQTNLIAKIISKSSAPAVLIINQEKEKQKLYDYFTSLNYFIPDFNASLLRQVNLLTSHPSRRKLLIITKDQIPDIIKSEDLNGFNYIVDSFELEEKWFISKGTGYLSFAEKEESGLKFKNDGSPKSSQKVLEEDNDESEISNPVSSSQDVFVLLKIQKPIIDYYRWLFHSADKSSTVWLTDSRLGDFAGLEEVWKASKYFIPIWNNDDEYSNDYKIIKTFFPSPIPKEEIKLDIEAAKNALRDIFLKEEATTHEWFPYQHDFLNEILPAGRDILVTLPTGGGKSLLFQAPALYRGSISGRLTIVVTPLKALMEDHVNKLWDLNFWASVECVNSDRKDTLNIYRRVAGGEILLLYITPERFRSKSFINALKMRLENDGGLEYAVYDEAHCVSQWGLDFRPDYLNSTNVNIALKQKSNSKFPLLLFSATVSEQIYNDFQSRFSNSINRLENYAQAYNPLREHIAINFETSEDADGKLTGIVESLHRGNFNPQKSRCLIFVRRRKDAEENVQELERKLNSIYGFEAFTGKVAYFHAGMNAEERQEVYNAYKSGDMPILLATKAFGMGMDIPNIHYLYHFGPSGTLEDYLQEVGRAGRHAKQLNDAGFSNLQPIQTKCFFEKDDFKRIKTLLQNGRITWANLLAVFKVIATFYSKFRHFEAESEKPIVLPFNILSQTSEFDEVHDKAQLLRLSLYWLEKLERIKLGFYAPGQLEFSDFIFPSDDKIENEQERKLIAEIDKAWKGKNDGVEAISIELNRLLTATEISQTSDLLKVIFICQKKKIFRYNNELTIYPTKKKMDELKYFNELIWKDPYYPMVEAVYELSTNLMGMTTEKQQRQFEGNIIEDQKRIIAGSFFNDNTLPWCKKTDANGRTSIDKKRIQNEQNDFERNKVKFAFTLADFIPKVRYQTLIAHKIGQKSKVVQVIYNGCKEKEDWKKYLKEFKKDLISLLKHVAKTYISLGSNGIRYNASKLVIDLGLEDKGTEYIENLLSFSNWLGYLHYEGTFLPMGIELYLLNQKEIRHEESNSTDKQTHEEFQVTQKLRELRLIALEGLSEFDGNKKYSKDSLRGLKDKFISEYFACESPDKIVSLLSKTMGENHPVLAGYRDEALKEKYQELSEEQRTVYDQDITNNVQVIAGPGSGKTHTLTLRVARLIHTENVKPENILVLAYNRAVVVELKERLTKLFSSLGYANIIQRVKVFTFHGFCKFCLKDSIQNLNFDEWIPKFIETAKKQPGIISNQLGVIKYVFVDEFQDITDERLELLKLIANPQTTSTTVIGDPNQSIYGYERVNEGGSRSPKENYAKFSSLYSPVELRLSYNYRSYPDILSLAEKVIATNEEKFGFTALSAIRKTQTKDYSEIINLEKVKQDWLTKLTRLLVEPHPENSKEKFHQVAIMFRSNREIYRAYNKIQTAGIPNIRLRIQGESEQFTRIREIAWILDFFEQDSNAPISKELVTEYRQRKVEIVRQFPNWDKYYLDFFECLLIEFNSQIEEDAVHNDLIEFVREVSQKDDGQLSKIYYKHYKEVNPDERKTEVVLTTMHKVKGLEFDAVIIPPSFTNLPMIEAELNPLTPTELKETIEEERRLLFVALTRARYRLVFFIWKREKAILEGKPFVMEKEEVKKIGIPIQAGFDKFFISWGARQYNYNNYFEDIEKNIKYGDSVSINRNDINLNGQTWTEWMLKSNSIPFGRLVRSPFAANERDSLTGFCVSGIYRYTFNDTVDYDLRHGTNYATNWYQNAQRKGYIYLVEFSGYGS